MKTSQQGVELIRDREGCRTLAYQDTVGVWTIGVGHTVGVTEGDRCTEEMARDWLAEDLQWAEAAVNNGVTVPLEQHQFDALVSFVFNVGQGAFQFSTLRRVLNEGRYSEAIVQFDRWHIPPEIITRRNAERDQFLGTQFVARAA
jgi:lysozyme